MSILMMIFVLLENPTCMQLKYLFIIIYVITVTIFLLVPKRGFDNVIKKYMDEDFKPEKRGFVYRGVQYYRMVILGAGIVAGLLTFFIRIIFY
jgi:hypothetical protein